MDFLSTIYLFLQYKFKIQRFPRFEFSASSPPRFPRRFLLGISSEGVGVVNSWTFNMQHQIASDSLLTPAHLNPLVLWELLACLILIQTMKTSAVMRSRKCTLTCLAPKEIVACPGNPSALLILQILHGPACCACLHSETPHLWQPKIFAETSGYHTPCFWK
jgi:hypothetical protein